MNHRKAVFFPGQAIEIDSVGWAIDVRVQRFQNVAGGVKLTGVDEDAVGPTDRGVHVGNVKFGHGTFVKKGAEAVAVLDSSEIDDGANAGIKTETETPVLPANFASGDLKTGAERLGDADGSGAGTRRGFQVLIVHRSLRNRRDSFFDHLKHFFFGAIHFDLQAFDIA